MAAGVVGSPGWDRQTNERLESQSSFILSLPWPSPTLKYPHILPEPFCTLSGPQAAQHLCPIPTPGLPIHFCAVRGWGPLTFRYRQDNLAERPTAQLILSKDTELVLSMGLQSWH